MNYNKDKRIKVYAPTIWMYIKNELHRYLYRQYEVKNEKDKHFQEIRVILNRIMNPASHASGEAMYERELESAIEKVKALKVFLGT